MRHVFSSQTCCLRIKDVILFLLFSLLIDKKTLSEDLKTLNEFPRVPCKSRIKLANEPGLQVDPLLGHPVSVMELPL